MFVDADRIGIWQVFLLEFTCTFVLVYVIFATAVDKGGAAKVWIRHSHITIQIPSFAKKHKTSSPAVFC